MSLYVLSTDNEEKTFNFILKHVTKLRYVKHCGKYCFIYIEEYIRIRNEIV